MQVNNQYDVRYKNEFLIINTNTKDSHIKSVAKQIKEWIIQ